MECAFFRGHQNLVSTNEVLLTQPDILSLIIVSLFGPKYKPPLPPLMGKYFLNLIL